MLKHFFAFALLLCLAPVASGQITLQRIGKDRVKTFPVGAKISVLQTLEYFNMADTLFDRQTMEPIIVDRKTALSEDSYQKFQGRLEGVSLQSVTLEVHEKEQKLLFQENDFDRLILDDYSNPDFYPVETIPFNTIYRIEKESRAIETMKVVGALMVTIATVHALSSPFFEKRNGAVTLGVYLTGAGLMLLPSKRKFNIRQPHRDQGKWELLQDRD